MRHIFALFAFLALFAQGAGAQLVQQANISFIGEFKVPQDAMGATYGLAYAGSNFTGVNGLAFNPANNSLYIGGHPYESRIAELNIPSSLTGVPRTTAIQNLYDATNGTLFTIAPGDCGGGARPIVTAGGLVYNSKYYFSAACYYDNIGQTASHWARPLTLSTSGQTIGPKRVGADYPGWVSRYQAHIPAAHQSALGGPALTGGGGGAINSQQSWGPSLYVFDPEDVNTQSPVPATRLLGYPIANPLNDGNLANLLWHQADNVTGAVIPIGSRSVLVFGTHARGDYCYGTGAACNDPVFPSQGIHGYPYQSWVWAYDINDLVAVKNGTKIYYQVQPYATWQFDTIPEFVLHGATIDPATNKLYVAFSGRDAEWPTVRVYQITVTGGVAPTITSITCDPGSVQSPGSKSCTVVAANDPISYTWTGAGADCSFSAQSAVTSLTCAYGGARTVCATATNASGTSEQACIVSPVIFRINKPTNLQAN